MSDANTDLASNTLAFLTKELSKALVREEACRRALDLIAAPKRRDGTYNRGREACEELARRTLEEINDPRWVQSSDLDALHISR